MFNSTHTLAGIALSRTGLDRLAPYATWTAVIASNLPDIDILAAADSTATYIDHHRGITHSLIGIPILSLLVAFVMVHVSKRFGKPPASLWRHFAVAFTAMATHPLLDWMNSYGLRPFLPFDGTWYRGDILFVIDPILDLILLTAILANRRKLLLIVLFYIAVMAGLRNAAARQLSTFAANITGITRSAVSPQLLSPFTWSGFLETGETISRVAVDVIDGTVTRLDQLPKGETSPVTVAAESTYTGGVFRGFARFPITRVESLASGYRVLFIDYQFFRASTVTALAAEIRLRLDLTVESESLSFARRLD